MTRAIVVLMLATLTGCAAPRGTLPVPETVAATFPIGYRCPYRGSLQVFNNPVMYLWTGTAPGQPDVCTAIASDGKQLRFVRGIFNVTTIDPDQVESVRDAMRRLTEEVPGRTVMFRVTDLTADLTSQRRVEWDHNMRVMWSEPLSIGTGAQARRLVTWRIDDELTTDGRLGGVMRYWVDRSSGVVVKVEASSVSRKSGYVSTTAALFDRGRS